MLAREAAGVAQSAIDALLPPLKRDLYALQRKDASAAITSLWRKLDAGTVSKAEHETLAAPHRVALAVHEDREAKTDGIGRWLAQVHSDIDDLTAETIDNWTLPALK